MKHNPSETPPSHFARNVVILVLVGAVVALTFWAMQLKRDRDDLAETKQPRVTPAGPTRPTEQRTTAAPVPEAEGEPAAAQKAAANPMAAMAAQMMNNPAMREMIATQQKRALEMRFADLFNELQFSPEQRTRFVALLAEGQSGAMDAGLKMMSGNLSVAERQALQQQMKDESKASEARIGEFFTSEFPAEPAKLDAYKRYVDIQPDRMQVTALQAAFTQAGEPMSAEQSNALVGILNEERKNFKFTMSPDEEPADMDAALTPEAVDTMIREQGQLQSRIAERAATLLSPVQLAALRENHANQLQTTKAGMEMARAMLGSGQPAAAK